MFMNDLIFICLLLYYLRDIIIMEAEQIQTLLMSRSGRVQISPAENSTPF